jgi:hypothetical protein
MGDRHAADPAFLKSAHLGGVQQARLVAEGLAREAEEWAAKVVVDSTRFSTGLLGVRDRAVQMDRHLDILHDEAARVSLKTLRHKTSRATGRVSTFEAPPWSVFAAEGYTPNPGLTLLTRKNDHTLFTKTAHLAQSGQLASPVNKDSVAIKEVDFQRFIHRHDNPRDRLVKAVHSRKHPPQDPSSPECRGPHWSTKAQSHSPSPSHGHGHAHSLSPSPSLSHAHAYASSPSRPLPQSHSQPHLHKDGGVNAAAPAVNSSHSNSHSNSSNSNALLPQIHSPIRPARSPML